MGRLMTRLAKTLHRTVCVLFTCLVMMGTAPVLAQVSAFEDPSVGGAGAAAGAQELSPAKSEIDGGDVGQGQTAQVIMMMRNNSSAPISLQKIDLLPSSNISALVAGNQCDKEPIKPGIECPITIAVKGESSGKYRLGILANHTGRTKVSNLAIIGAVVGGTGSGVGGLPSNELEAFPGNLDFGQAKGRTPQVRSIAIHNASPKAVEIKNITLAASPLTGYSVSAPDCKILAASSTCAATVTWTPTTEGKAEGAIVLTHDGPSGTMQIPLTAEYAAPKTEKAERFPAAVAGQGLIIADRDTVEFGSEIDGAASITVSLVNTGDKTVLLKQVRLAGSDNGLSLSGDDCISGKELEPNQGCALTVNWLPRRKGPVIDDIQIIHTGARGILVLPVRGTAKDVVSLNMPIIGGANVPRMSTSDLDEKVLGDVDDGKGGKKKSAKTGGAMSGITSDFALATDPNALNGYRITSLSTNRAVVTGPRGRIMVSDGQPQVIAGGRWIPRITTEGVELIGDRESVVLLFDRSLGTITANGGQATFSAATAAPAATETSTDSKSEGGTTTP